MKVLTTVYFDTDTINKFVWIVIDKFRDKK